MVLHHIALCSNTKRECSGYLCSPLLPVGVSRQCYSPPLACSSQWVGPASLQLQPGWGPWASSGGGQGQRRTWTQSHHEPSEYSQRADPGGFPYVQIWSEYVHIKPVSSMPPLPMHLLHTHTLQTYTLPSPTPHIHLHHIHLTCILYSHSFIHPPHSHSLRPRSSTFTPPPP